MNSRAILLVAVASLTLGGCFGSTTPWDRPWVDFGCDAPGVCRVRGTLGIGETGVWPHGRLTLDDGRCLSLDLPSTVVRDRAAWDGRRVAVRGQAVERTVNGRCADESLLLYAERVSLRPPQ